MEPLKKIQVDGFAMFAEPELLFGNLDELCCVSIEYRNGTMDKTRHVKSILAQWFDHIHCYIVVQIYISSLL